MNEFEITQDYYDHHWSLTESPSAQEQDRIRETISLIPEGVSSILDVGCGDGRITNRLLSRYAKVVGLDSSREALRYVETEKLLGTVDSLPFSDKSFDLILCCEVLEHLPFSVYPRALGEIERVATKHIIVTVPNNEDIRRASVTCPLCGCSFHPWRHLRSFSQESMPDLFNEFKAEIIETYRPSTKVYPLLTVMGKVAERLKLVSAPGFPADALCPQCGYGSAKEISTVHSDRERSRLSFLAPPAKVLAIKKKSRGWLLVLYQRV